MEFIKKLLPDKYESLAIFILIILLTVLVEWVSRRAVNRFIRKSSQDINSDPTNYKFLSNALRGIIYSIGIMLAVREYPPLRAVAGSLLAGAGILAVAIGFASQQAFSNIISGIFLVIFKPFRVNDRLRVKDIYVGVVEDITLRHTVIRDPENRRIIIPNSVIATEVIVNSDYNDGKICKYVEFNVSLKTDIDKAKRIIAEEIARHPKYIDPRKEEEKTEKPLVEVRLMRFTDFAMVLRGSAWATTNNAATDMQLDLLESIKKRFDAEGVEMPYPHFVIMKKD
ncbi:MAG: mechanosensitive ion channel family protein [Saprospiraceae bacterium]|nr:mechanosensitive ion channel family protein [Saprospiraceae bacterium]